MVIKKQNISDDARKKKKNLQEHEIKERLNHITNKILVMSGKGVLVKAVWRPIYPWPWQRGITELALWTWIFMGPASLGCWA